MMKLPTFFPLILLISQPKTDFARKTTCPASKVIRPVICAWEMLHSYKCFGKSCLSSHKLGRQNLMIFHIFVSVSQMKKGHYLTSCSEDHFNQVCRTQRYKGDVTTEKTFKKFSNNVGVTEHSKWVTHSFWSKILVAQYDFLGWC